MLKKYVCIPRSFLVTNVCNQGKTLCSPYTTDHKEGEQLEDQKNVG